MTNPSKKIYRVSAKALIFNEMGQILLCKEKTGLWELPGGGIEYGDTPEETITRELKEECGFDVATVSKQPSLVWSVYHENWNEWVLCIAYTTTLSSMNFIPSEECEEYRFVDISKMNMLPLHANIKSLPELLGEL